MPKVKAVLLDLDGVVRDSMEATFRSIEGGLEKHGVRLPRDAVRPHAHSLTAVHNELVPHLDYQALRDEYDRIFLELAPLVVLHSDVTNTLEEIRQSRKVALVSSARFAADWLTNKEVAHLFDVLVTGLDVDRQHLKPDPLPVNVALQRLDCSPAEAIMVDDLPAGIIAAKRAGLLATVASLYGAGTEAMLQAELPDYYINSFPEILQVLDTIEQL